MSNNPSGPPSGRPSHRPSVPPVQPLLDEYVEFEGDALKRVIEVTQGYPYFLQEWGKFCWNTAEKSRL